jgi:hypothetical protein
MKGFVRLSPERSSWGISAVEIGPCFSYLFDRVGKNLSSSQHIKWIWPLQKKEGKRKKIR